MAEAKPITIHEKLARVQLALKVPKGQKGRFGNYRNLDDMLDKVKPLLQKEGLTLTIDNQVIECGGRTYIQATARLIGAGKDGPEVLTASAQAWEGDLSRGLDSPQVSGAASTYARKYAVAGLFAIADDSADPDGHMEPSDAVQDSPAPKSVSPANADKPATEAQRKAIFAKLKARAIGANEAGAVVRGKFGLDSGAHLTMAQASELLDELSNGTTREKLLAYGEGANDESA